MNKIQEQQAANSHRVKCGKGNEEWEYWKSHTLRMTLVEISRSIREILDIGPDISNLYRLISEASYFFAQFIFLALRSLTKEANIRGEKKYITTSGEVLKILQMTGMTSRTDWKSSIERFALNKRLISEKTSVHETNGINEYKRGHAGWMWSEKDR